MSAPAIWIFIPFVAGVIILFFVNERYSAVVGGAVALLLSLTALIFPIDTALLIGSISLKEKKFSDAIAAFEEAVVTEEGMVYNEPRDWLLNPKHYLGNAYYKAGRYKEAKDIFEKDLLNNRENGWALFGIWQSLNAQHKTNEANKMLQRFRKAFNKADVKLYGSVF